MSQRNAASGTSLRRNYYIDKNFQTKFIIKFCMLVLLGSMIVLAVVYWLARHSTTVAIVDGRVGVHASAEYLLPLLVQTFFVELIVVCVATVGMTMFISHQIAGPLFRLKVMLSGLGEGDVATSMHLRQGDQLQEVAKSYNDAINKLNYKIKMLKDAKSLEEVKRELDKFKTS